MKKDIRNTFYDKSEKQKKQCLAYRKNKILNSDNSLLKNMMNIVEENLKAYFSDFYIHDVELVKECGDEPFIWVVREYGTHFLYLHSENFSSSGKWDKTLYFHSLRFNFDEFKGIYLFENGELQNINIKQAEDVLKRYEEVMRQKLKITA